MKVINLYGGPGSGKSTAAAAIFAALKHQRVNVELVREFAKDLVYEKSNHILDNQLYVTAMQYKRLKDLQNYGVQTVITDSPLDLGIFYGHHVSYYEELCDLIKKMNQEFENIDVLVARCKPYNPMGRLQTEEESNQITEDIIKFKQVFQYRMNGSPEGQSEFIKFLVDSLKVS